MALMHAPAAAKFLSQIMMLVADIGSATPASPQRSIFAASALAPILLDFNQFDEGARDVDLALRLNVLAVFAVFAFVGAVLLGAF